MLISVILNIFFTSLAKTPEDNREEKMAKKLIYTNSIQIWYIKIQNVLNIEVNVHLFFYSFSKMPLYVRSILYQPTF